MSDSIDLPLDGDDQGHIVDPPIVDYLFLNAERDVYAVTFVPQDSVSESEKEVVEVGRTTPDGRRITANLQQIGRIIGGDVDRAFHAGGGDFGFYRTDGRLVRLSDSTLGPGRTLEVFGHLQDIGATAEIAYLAARPSAARSA